MKKFEFCAVGPMWSYFQPFKNELYVRFILSTGMSERKYSTPQDITNFFHWLINQGWELTCAGGVEVSESAVSSLMRGPGGGIQAHMLYFKREIEKKDEGES